MTGPFSEKGEKGGGGAEKGGGDKGGGEPSKQKLMKLEFPKVETKT